MTLVSTDDPAPAPARRRDARAQAERAERRERRGGWGALVLRALLAAVLVILVGIGVAAILVPAVTGSTTLTVLTSSMEPHLPPGTMVVVRPTDVDDIQPGMVITYQLESGEPLLVTHRVVQRLQTADGLPLFVTQGDANPQPDPEPVREVQIRGTVWYAIPYIGWVANAISGDLRTVLVTIAVIGLLGYALWMFGSALFGGPRRRRATAPVDAPVEAAVQAPADASAEADSDPRPDGRTALR